MEASSESKSEMSNGEETNIEESIEQIAKEKRIDGINDALVSAEAQDLEYEIPTVGKEFVSDEQAYDFYKSYARIIGFSIRRGRSGKTQKGVVWRRIFECSKEGYRRVDKRTLNLRKSRPDRRTGCKARMVVKRMKDGKWSVTEIAYEHNHPLATETEAFLLRSLRVIKPTQVGIVNDSDDCVIQEKASTSSHCNDMCHQSVSFATPVANSEKATLPVKTLLRERTEDVNDAFVSRDAQDVEYEIPSVGKEFVSDEQAYDFYNSYARKIGFSVRRGRSGKTQKGVVWRRIFECSKEGYRRVDKRTLSQGKSRPDRRTGCKARMVIKRMKDGKWSVTEIAYEHNHPLATEMEAFSLRSQRVVKPTQIGIVNDNDGCVIQEKASTSSHCSDMCRQTVSLATPVANSENSTLSVKTLLRERTDDICDAFVSGEAQDLECEIPSVGKEFVSDEQAYDFYNSYARKIGFSIRRGRSGKTQKGVVWRRIFECSKEGHRRVDKRTLNLRKSRPDRRTGCKARMVVKRMRNGKWSVTEISYEHNHPLATETEALLLRSQRVVKPTLVGIVNDNDGCVIQEKASTGSRYSDMCQQSATLATRAANSEKATLFVKTLLRDGQEKVEEILKEEAQLKPKTSALICGDPMSQRVYRIQAKDDGGLGGKIISILEKKRKMKSQSSNSTQAKKGKQGQNNQNLEGNKQAFTQAQSQLNLMSCPLPCSGPIQFQHSFSPLVSHHITNFQEMSKDLRAATCGGL
ncbi:uncharacterized protein LOC122073773 isoform X2 [Macadamia integrifolia]|uniref:uncharacterized protein LOC122073773 isoform X2 n=1 Tax=Macadamia integrifolia TaxID=60698 RepID=UPI001C4EE12F|nr:uncharacterized protein LOC122073773 isoform X2 [Macadamia integrifolia]